MREPEGEPVPVSKPGYRVVAPDRFVRTEPAPGRVTVSFGGTALLSSDRALALHEGERPVAWYLPAEAARGLELVPSGRTYACRWKGEASYFHVLAGDARIEDGAWSYADPPADLAALAGHLSFDAQAFEVRCEGDGA